MPCALTISNLEYKSDCTMMILKNSRTLPDTLHCKVSKLLILIADTPQKSVLGHCVRALSARESE